MSNQFYDDYDEYNDVYAYETWFDHSASKISENELRFSRANKYGLNL